MKIGVNSRIFLEKGTGVPNYVACLYRKCLELDKANEYVFFQPNLARTLGPTEIAEALTMPPGLENDWSTHGYYGTISHNSKAVYQRYVGWYDGNPATLNRLPRVEEAKKYLAYMGGSAAVIARAREDFKAGQYRWVAQVMDQVVFADPSNKEARNLAADAFEQLGYLAESATWRNAYLLGAQELRNGVRGGARSSVTGIGAESLAAKVPSPP